MQEFRRYPITYTIILINTLLYLFTALYSGSLIDMDLRVLVDFGALYGPLCVGKAEWGRLVSAMFLHGGMTHLLMNMVSLYVIGRGMELYFPRHTYVLIYLFSGLIGGMVSLYVHPQSVGIGASGAIFGVFGALAGFFLAHYRRIGAYSREFMKDFAVMLGLNLLLGLSIASIDMSAHLGGLVAGLSGGFLLSKFPALSLLYAGVMLFVIWMGISALPEYYAQVYR
jgi:rhomboid protease GluP